MDVTRAAGAVSAGQLPEGSQVGPYPHVYSDGLVCCLDSPLVELRRTCVRVAASQATVLLTGETGTGKEVFARLIHAHSPRVKRQFVPVNCGAIPEALLESELFGYVKGAFTGAVTPRKGRVALAEGGTLFLDEIGELPLALQVKLLRLLQQRTYEPVGSSESVLADFRLVAATNRDLQTEVRAGRFRQDLYYRLNVCPLHLPPLRSRRGDAVALFQHFWRARGETRPLEPGVLQRLEGYDWPGNVRELENLVERVSVIAEGTSIRIVDLPPPFCDPEPGVPASITDLISARNPTNLLPTTGLPLTTTMPPPMRDGLSGLNGSHEGGAAAVRSAIESTLESAVVPVVAATMAAAAAAMDGAVNSLPPSAPPSAALPSAPMAAGDSIEVSLHTPPPVAVAPAPLAPMSVTPEPSPMTPTPTVQPLPVNLPVLLKELEEAYIAEALTQSGGNKKEAARLLGMGRTTLVEKLRRRNADTQGS